MVVHLLPIRTSNGPVIGFADTDGLRETSASAAELRDGGKSAVWKWLGIPYAQAGRWERPREPEAWTEPKPALEFGTMFHQSSGMSRFWKQRGWFKRDWVKSSEESHFVNVYSPPDVKADEVLPVLVWIYGGSLNNGSSDRFMYDATELVRRGAENGDRFIVVTGNYRTNIFGFFSSPELVEQDSEGLSGNYGLYDVVFLLEWVQKNISYFGGAPANTTVFGESAGAFLISHLLVSGRKLFRRAIMQSGAPETMSMTSPSESYPSHAEVAASLIPSRATAKARLNGLQTLPVEELFQLHVLNYGWNGVRLTIESGPHATWKEDSLDKIKRGEWDEWIDEVVVGTTEHEATYFLASLSYASPDVFQHFLSHQPRHLHAEITAKYASLPGTDIKSAPTTLFLNDSLFVNPAFSLCAALSGVTNAKSGKKIGVYKYRCRASVDRISVEVDPKVDTGAMHVIDLPLVFNLDTLWEKGAHEESASKTFGTLWYNFAKTGVPDPDWKPFTIEEPSWFAIDNVGNGANEDLKGWEVGRVDFTGRGFCLPKNI